MLKLSMHFLWSRHRKSWSWRLGSWQLTSSRFEKNWCCQLCWWQQRQSAQNSWRAAGPANTLVRFESSVGFNAGAGTGLPLRSTALRRLVSEKAPSFWDSRAKSDWGVKFKLILGSGSKAAIVSSLKETTSFRPSVEEGM